jgi:hypothetical protein
MVNAAGKRRVKSQYFEQQVQSKSTAIQMTRAKGRASDDVLTRAAARGCRGRRDVADGLSMRTDSGDVSACQAAALQGSKSVGNSIGKRLKNIAMYLEQKRDGLVVQQSECVGGETLSMDFVGRRALKLCTASLARPDIFF